MPTYNYACDSCDNTFSIMQSIKDDALKKCNKCNGNISRIISGNMGLIFKGSGFYLTDYVKKNKTKTNKQTTKSKSSKKENNKK